MLFLHARSNPKMKLSRKTVTTCISVLIAGMQFVAAQRGGQFIDQSQDRRLPFTIVQYGTKHGLPQNQVIDIVAKKNGNLILSTANGIVEYNGHAFYNFIDSRKYEKQFHIQLFWDDHTQQLFGSERRVLFNRIYPQFVREQQFMAVDVSKGTITGIGRDGVLRTKPTRSGTKYEDICQTGMHDAQVVYADANGYYVGDGKVLKYIDKRMHRQQTVLEEAIILVRKNPYSGRLYALSTQKIWELTTAHQPQPLPLKHSDPEQILTDIAFVDANRFFISSLKGLLYIRDGQAAVYSKKDHLPSQLLQSLHYNREEACLFVGTADKGLLKLQLKNCFSFFDSPGIGDASLGSVIQTKAGEILTMGSRGALYKAANPGKMYFEAPVTFASLSDVRDTLYAGTWGMGILLVKNRKACGYVSMPRLPSNIVHAVFEDSRGQIWVGTEHGAAMGRNSASIRPLADTSLDNCIITIYECRNGMICLGGSGKFFLLTPNGKLLRTIGAQDGFSGKEVRSFYEDAEGKLWIGTYNGGLLCYFRGKLTSINNMPYSNLQTDIFTLARDSKGFIYMTSNKGLWAVSEKKLNDFYHGRIPYLVPFYFGEETGIWNTEFNGGFQNNYLHTADDRFYFPGLQGLVLKIPGTLQFRKLQPAFRAVRVNDTLVPLHMHSFGRLTHTIQFEFECPGYADKFNVLYQYKLNGPGLPDTWSNMQATGEVSFKMLPPGRYVFKIRAIDGFNDDVPQVRRFAFEILPHFYETTWFRILFTVWLVIAAVLINRYRYYVIRRKERQENNISNTILELKLKAIQSKMDPHFIFNALNNIIYLLNAEKYQEAEDLLHDFSLLLRQFLEKSDHTFLSLREELAIVDLYLRIEQKRYNQRFSYEISYGDDIRHLEIPTLLIQPFVENAVKHGISHTDRDCFIRIEALPTPKGIQITIEDNGIGRKKSALINQNRKNHSSKGIGLVLEKMRIMQQKYGLEIKLEIIDLEDGPHSGTLVRLNIPFV